MKAPKWPTKTTKVHRAKRKSNWGNPIIDKLMQLKYSLNDAYHNDGVDTKDDKNYVMSLIKDVRKNGLIKLSHEDGLLCNALWRKYAN